MLKVNGNNINLIVSDIDGTLLDDEKTIPNINVEAIQKAMSNGLFFSICSGRMPKGFLKIVKALDDKNCVRYIIGANGAAIYDIQDDKYVFFDVFTLAETKLIREISEKHNGYYQICSDDAQVMYFSSEEKYKQNYLYKFGGNVDGTTSAEIINDNHENIIGCKFTVFFTTEVEFKKFKEDLESHSQIEVKQISPTACDIVPNNNTKWTGILRLANILNKAHGLSIEGDNVLYFGDEMNDLAVFENCPNTVAMGNGNPQIKKLASFIGDTNNDGGVGKFIIQNWK